MLQSGAIWKAGLALRGRPCLSLLSHTQLWVPLLQGKATHMLSSLVQGAAPGRPAQAAEQALAVYWDDWGGL